MKDPMAGDNQKQPRKAENGGPRKVNNTIPPMAEDELDKIFDQFVISNVDAPPSTPVLYCKRGDVNGVPYIGLATLRDIKETKQAINAYTTNKIEEALEKLMQVAEDMGHEYEVGMVLQELDRIKSLNHRKDK